jgi:hypothetical protein
MRKFLPFAVFAVILSSGCTIPVLNIDLPFIPDIWGPTVVQYEHDVVIIKSLEAIPMEIDSKQTTKIVAYIENIGAETIGEDHPIEVDLYDYCVGLFKPTLETCGSGSSGVKTSSTLCTIKKIQAGQTVPVRWSLEPIKDVEGRTICPPDGVKVSVKYHYETGSLTTIQFVSQEEYERSLEQRTEKSTDSYIRIDQGPIKPYITVEDKQPIPVFSGARTVLALNVENRGNGQLVEREIPRESITVKGLGEVSQGMELTPEEDCYFKDGKPKENVILIGNKAPKMLCRVDLSRFKAGKQTSVYLETSIEYDYIFTKSVQVVVNPKIAG